MMISISLLCLALAFSLVLFFALPRLTVRYPALQPVVTRMVRFRAALFATVLAGIAFVAAQQLHVYEVLDAQLLLNLTLIAFFICAFLLVAQVARSFERTLTTNQSENHAKTTVSALFKVVYIVITALFLFLILDTLGFKIGSLLAVGGVAGIALSWAAKDFIANIFGGVTIYLDRPFGVGDWVRSLDHPIEGTVEDIGLRQTRILTFDKRPLYVPNSLFTTMVIENAERMQNRRIKQTFGVRYEDHKALPAIFADIQVYLDDHEGIDHAQTNIVHFVAFGESELVCELMCYTTAIALVDFRNLQQALLFKVLAIIEAHGAEVPFPTRTLHTVS